MQGSRKRRGSPPTVAAAALALVACMWSGADSASGYPGAATSGGYPPQQQPPQQQTPQQQQYNQQQQQQQQQYRSAGPGQAPPSGGAEGGGGGVPQGPSYGRGDGRGAMPPQGYRGGPPPNPNQQQQGGYGRQPQGQGGAGSGYGGGGGGYGGGGSYPSGQAGYGGRSSYTPPGMSYPREQQPMGGGDASGGFLSRMASKLWGTDDTQSARGQQGYGDRYGGGGSQYAPPGAPPQGWQPSSRSGMALQPTGSSRGPIQSGYQGQDGGYGGRQPTSPQAPQHQPYSQQQQPYSDGSGIADSSGMGIWTRFKGKVFSQGNPQGVDERPPSFRPKGSILLKKKKEDEDAARMANGSGQAFGGPGAFGNPYPSFGGPPGMGIGAGDTTSEPSGPGVPEVISVEDSIVLVLKPNELTKKKRKFKQDGASKLQVITTFDHCLTGFHAKDGKGPCLKTTDILEQNQQVMLPEAAKKVRFLRSDFKRRMEADGKGMSPEDRVAALEDNLRKVYSAVSMEGGVHMNSIGPAIESQLDSIPLRAGVDDMTAALAWRAIPMTIFCAGYGNVAMEVLRKGSPRITGPGGIFTPHLRLVANFFRPDDTMTIIGMYDTVPLIHEAKKSGATLMEFLRGVGHENVFASRSNVLLLGAELSDLGLAAGLPAVEERISVGFLKLDEHFMEKLPRYAQAYDVVVIGDGDMSYTNEILHEIVG